MSKKLPDETPAVNSMVFLRKSLDHTFLNAAEERSLITRAQAGDESALVELLAHNEKLIHKTALYFWRAGVCGENEITDLQQYGRMGFIKAVSRFKIESGNRLSTYATSWIKQAIRRYGISSGAQIGISFRDNEIRAQMVKARTALERKLQHDISFDEISAYTSKPLKQVRHLLSFHFESLDAPGKDEGDSILAQTLQDSTVDVEQDGINQALVAKVRSILNELPEMWAKVIAMRFGLDGNEPSTPQDIAQALLISRTRVYQIEIAAMTIIRQKMS